MKPTDEDLLEIAKKSIREAFGGIRGIASVGAVYNALMKARDVYEVDAE